MGHTFPFCSGFWVYCVCNIGRCGCVHSVIKAGILAQFKIRLKASICKAKYSETFLKVIFHSWFLQTHKNILSIQNDVFGN